uniref:Putative sun domain-containing ossification factor n=1 Tax=Anopheles marajoara TaxID=58244 RepID=A0A2M4B9A0_9DIPT
MFMVVNLYLIAFCYLKWQLSMKLVSVITERVRRMRKLTILVTFCWVALVSQIVAISNLYHDGLQDIPGPPSVITLVDHQHRELKSIESKLEENLEATLKNLSHNIQPVSGPSVSLQPEKHVPAGSEQHQHDLAHDATSNYTLDANGTEPSTEPEQPELIVIPVDEGGHAAASGSLNQDHTIPKPTAKTEDGVSDDDTDLEDEEVVADAAGASDDRLKAHEVNLTEENPMPVFSEWAEKQMAEAEKKKQGEVVNASVMRKGTKPAGSKTGGPMKLRAKNYAAPECGAKIIASNPEAQSTGSVLTAPKDEYLLNPCTSKIWFVVELCEPVQAERIELANFELFSSSPKDFTVSVSNRFPTRDWANVGRFTAKDERDVQSFPLHPHLFGKFVRVEILSHYNQEHFCPVSLFRVYGTSEFEAFETDNTPTLPEEDDDEDDEELLGKDKSTELQPSIPGSNGVEREDAIDQERGSSVTSDGKRDVARKGKNPNNILKSAGEVVLSMVKKAAEALGKTGPDTNDSFYGGSDSFGQTAGDQRHLASSSSCVTLAYTVRCVNCSDAFRARLETTMNCKHNLLTSLLEVAQIGHSFVRAQHFLCANVLGFNIPPISATDEEICLNMRYSVLNLLPDELVAGLCNVVAADLKLLPTYEPASAATAPIERKESETDSSQQRPVDAEASLPNGGHGTVISETNIPPQQPTDQTGNDEQSVDAKHEPPVVHDPSAALQPDSQQESKVIEAPDEDNDVNMFNLATETPLVDTQSPTAEDGEESSQLSNQHRQQQQQQHQHSQEQQDRDEPTGSQWDTAIDDGRSMPITGGGTGPSEGGNRATDGSYTTTTSFVTPPPTGPSKGQPESVFLRLSNRIKALERNMSLSGQYLEELSRRYRKQVEELQHSYAKTLHEIEEQNRRMRDSEATLRDVNERLRLDLNSFQSLVIDWRNVAIAVVIAILLMLVTLIVLVHSLIVSSRINARNSTTNGGSQPAPIPQNILDRELAQVGSDAKPIRGKMLRRKSIDGGMPLVSGAGSGSAAQMNDEPSSLVAAVGGGAVSTMSPSRLRKKRPSEEALNVSGTSYVSLLINDPPERDAPVGHNHNRASVANGPTVMERKRGKQKHRKVSAPSMFGTSTPTSAVVGEPGGSRGREPPKRSTSMFEPQERSAAQNGTGGSKSLDDGNRIEELPFLEDNDEFIIPTASDLSYDEFVPPVRSGEMKRVPNGAVNGIPREEDEEDETDVVLLELEPSGNRTEPNNLEAKKLSKSRRLSSPAFFKASLLRSSIGKKRSSKLDPNSSTSSTDDGRRSSKKSTNSTHSASSSSGHSSGGNTSSNSSNISSNNVTVDSDVSTSGNRQPAVDVLAGGDGAKSNRNGSNGGGWDWYRLKQRKGSSKTPLAPSSQETVVTSSRSVNDDTLLSRRRSKEGSESLADSMNAGGNESKLSSVGEPRKLSVSFNGGELARGSSGDGLERKASGGRGSIRRLFRKVF